MLAVLAKLRDEFSDLGGKEMVVVFEAGSREPILVVRTQGLGAFMSLVSELQDLELTDRLVDQSHSEQGVDAAFS